MKKAIQFGAGNIGRGFIGAVLEKAGYHVVFADVNEQIVDRINRDKGYTVQIMDTVCEEVRITDISAVDSRTRAANRRSGDRHHGRRPYDPAPHRRSHRRGH